MLWFKEKKKISSQEYDNLYNLVAQLSAMVEVQQKRIDLLEETEKMVMRLADIVTAQQVLIESWGAEVVSNEKR